VKFPGVKLLKKTVNGWTCLHLAARNGHDDVLSLLLRTSRTILNARTNNGCTALHLACIGKHPEAVRVLLEEDEIDPNIQMEKHAGGKTPLHFAAELGFVDGVWMLLESGRTNRELISTDGLKAFDLARKYNRYAVVRLF
jgi:ankyrin repeat protein